RVTQSASASLDSNVDRTIEHHHLDRQRCPETVLYRLPISLSPPVQRSELRRWRSLRDPDAYSRPSDRAPDTVPCCKIRLYEARSPVNSIVICSRRFEGD